MDLALNNLQRLICHKTNQPNKQTNKENTNTPQKKKKIPAHQFFPNFRDILKVILPKERWLFELRLKKIDKFVHLFVGALVV